MAPLVPRRGDAAEAAMRSPRWPSLQAELLRNSQWVGDEFAETARAMHLGEIDTAAGSWRKRRASEAQSLVEDGVPIAPLPLPVVPPNQVN